MIWDWIFSRQPHSSDSFSIATQRHPALLPFTKQSVPDAGATQPDNYAQHVRGCLSSKRVNAAPPSFWSHLRKLSRANQGLRPAVIRRVSVIFLQPHKGCLIPELEMVLSLSHGNANATDVTVASSWLLAESLLLMSQWPVLGCLWQECSSVFQLPSFHFWNCRATSVFNCTQFPLFYWQTTDKIGPGRPQPLLGTRSLLFYFKTKLPTFSANMKRYPRIKPQFHP